MAADERNFRSAYYEKVGFRSVEEKKSLDILLKDKPLDRGKLKQFCLRFSIPAIYRCLIWKLLLGVVPVHVDCHPFVMDQRKQTYRDLLRALNVMKIIEPNTPKPQIFFAMWMLQAGKFAGDISLVSEKGFIPIAQSFMHFVEDDSDIYWLSKNFYDNVCRFESDIPKLIDRSYTLLEKEDPTYYKHLVKDGILINLPLAKWFDCCFAGILNENALAKIWDKLCGGSYKILVYLVVMLLINIKVRILKCSTFAGVLQYIKNIPEETADIIVNKSIEIWQQNGSPLTIHDKPCTK